MATRSTIAVVHSDGTVSQIYCHYDGYLEGVGETLVSDYNQLDRIERLVSLGDVSILGKYLDPVSSDHTFGHPDPDVTVFYGRDRGETGVNARRYSTVTEYLNQGQVEEYNYLYQVGEWFYSRNNLKNFKSVSRILDNENV
jgi:hypothetical protein